MSNWLDDNNANRYKKSYYNGFIDISGGDLILREGSNAEIKSGNINLNGNIENSKLTINQNNLIPSGGEDTIKINGKCNIQNNASINNNYLFSNEKSDFKKPMIITQDANSNDYVGLSINTNNAIKIPSGNILERPGVGAQPAAESGQIRYNTVSNKFEGYENGKWVTFSSLYDNDLNTYISIEDSDKIKFFTGGEPESSVKMIVDKNGNVGIGKEIPNYKLEVNGEIYSSSNIYASKLIGADSQGELQVDNNVIFNDNVSFSKNIGINKTPIKELDVNGSIGASDTLTVNDLTIDNNCNFSTNTNDITFIPRSSNGTFNIQGTLNVDGKIIARGDVTEINTEIQITNQIDVSNNGTGPALIARQHGDKDIAEFYDDNQLALTIKNGGNVGINTNTPLCKLDINGNDAIKIPTGLTSERPVSNTNGLIRYNTTTSHYEGYSNGWINLNGVIDNDKDTYISAENSPDIDNDQLKFFTASNQRMVIDSNGNTGINTTNPQHNLDVNGDINASNKISVSTLSFNKDSIIASDSDITFQPQGITSTVGNVNIKGGLNVEGTFNVVGEVNITETELQISQQVDISNNGTSTALNVKQHGVADVAEFYDEGKLAMIIKNGGKIGLGVAFPDEKLECNGNLKIIDFDEHQPKIMFDISRNFPLSTIPIDQEYINNYPFGAVLNGINRVIFDNTTLEVPNTFKLTVMDDTIIDGNNCSINYNGNNGSLILINDANVTIQNITLSGSNKSNFLDSNSYAFNKIIDFYNCNQLTNSNFLTNDYYFGTKFNPFFIIGENTLDYSNQQFLYAVGNFGAFAAINKDNTISTWGNPEFGAVSVPSNFDYEYIYTSNKAFTAIKINKTIESWGNPDFGGNIIPAYKNFTYDHIASIKNDTFGAFAGLTTDNKIYSWGNSTLLNFNLNFDDNLNRDFTSLISNTGAFSGLKTDGSIYSWGWKLSTRDYGQNIQTIIDNNAITNNNFISISSSGNNDEGAFAAVKNDNKTVLLWGSITLGGLYNDSRIINMTQNISTIIGSTGAFACLLNDGSIFTWGALNYGGKIENEQFQPDSNGYIQLFSNGDDFGASFCALHSDGHLYFWGHPDGSYFNNSIITDNKLYPSDGRNFINIKSSNKAYTALDNEGNVFLFGTLQNNILPSDSGYTDIFFSPNTFIFSNNKPAFQSSQFNFDYCNISGNHPITNYNGALSSYNSFKDNNTSFSIDNCDFHVDSIDSTSFLLFGPNSFSNGSLNLTLSNSNFKSDNGGNFFQSDLPVNLTYNNIYYDINNILTTSSISNQLTITPPTVDIINMVGNGNNLIMRYNGNHDSDHFFSFYSESENWAKNGESLNIIPSTGNVGIGVINPSHKFEVNGDISANVINCNEINTDYSLTFTLNVNINNALSSDNDQKFYFTAPRNCRLSNLYINSDTVFTDSVEFRIKLLDDDDTDEDAFLKKVTFNYSNPSKPGKITKVSLIDDDFFIDDYEKTIIQLVKKKTEITNPDNANFMVTLDFNY